MSFAVASVEAIRNLQPTALPACVIVEHVKKTVEIRVVEEINEVCKSRLMKAEITGTYIVKIIVDKGIVSPT